MTNNLTTYQRGNRDGLASFAKWAQSMYKTYKEEADRLELKACENRSLARDNVRMTITTMRWNAQCFKSAAEQAYRMSESLPIDPLENEEGLNE